MAPRLYMYRYMKYDNQLVTIVAVVLVIAIAAELREVPSSYQSAHPIHSAELFVSGSLG